jgi:peptidyl-prolyl cis-trans isomerase D
MAVIGKIRQRAGLLIGLVGFSLAAFVLGDLFTSNRSFIGGGNPTDVAIIGDTKISVQDFEALVTQLTENYKINTGTDNVDQATVESLRDQAWTQLMSDHIIMKQLNKTGLVVSSDELFDMIQGKNPHPQIKQSFTDPNTGQFSPANVLQFLKNMDNDPTGASRAQWVSFEGYIKEERIKEKYNKMIEKGLFVTTEQGKRDYKFKNNNFNIQLMMLDYGMIEDSTVQVTDAQLRDYYNSHQNDFEQEASRKIEYVVFDVFPSKEDRSKVYESVTALVDEFSTTENDSLFSLINSDDKQPITWYKQGELSPAIDTTFFNENTNAGLVYGPYEENSSVKLAKLLDSQYRSDSIKVSHALISYVNDFASNQSDDKVSAEDAGNLDWLSAQSPMDPQFLDGAFNTQKGGISLVESPFGFHIIKVTDAKDQSLQVKVAFIDRRIEPGSKTYQAAFSQANEFAGVNNTSELFEAAIQEQGLTKRIADDLKETDKVIAGIENPRSLVIWAYRSEKGQVSKAYEFTNKFVVAHLVEVQEKGVAPYEDIKDKLTEFVLKDNKAVLFEEQINAAMQNSKDIEQIASELSTRVTSATNVNFGSSFIEGVGVEPALIANVVATKQDEFTQTVQGQSGVFLAFVSEIIESPEPTDVKANVSQLQSQTQQRSTYEVFEALTEKANVVDNRGKFY